MPGPSDAASPAEISRRVVAEYLVGTGLDVEEAKPGTFVVTLPGERKLLTTVSLVVGDHAVSINSFVARAPEENHEEVYRWLLERNRRTYAVAYALDHLGDVYLSGRLPHSAVTADELDHVLGCILEYSDGSFNTLLELGFATAIRREWKWRTEHGEPTTNLDAFRHLIEESTAD